MCFSVGGIIRPDNNVTVTVSDNVDAGEFAQIFDVSLGGAVGFQNPQTVYPEWWGENDTALWNACKRTAAGTLIKLKGRLYNTVPILFINGRSNDGLDTAKVIEGVTPAQRYETIGSFTGTRIRLIDGQDDDVIRFTSESTASNVAFGLSLIHI